MWKFEFSRHVHVWHLQVNWVIHANFCPLHAQVSHLGLACTIDPYDQLLYLGRKVASGSKEYLGFIRKRRERRWGKE